ncbi:Prostate-specific antigen, partial [Folsomia candida]
FSSYLHSDTVTTDVCILHLTEPLQLNNFFRTIPACRAEPSVGTICTATGWGDTCKNEPSNDTKAQHDHSFPPRNGDSGGPLVCGSGSFRCLAGAVSFGGEPCAIEKPAGFANVAWLYNFFMEDK